MGNEITYDNASSAELITPIKSSEDPKSVQGQATDLGCHSNSVSYTHLRAHET